jgi:prepilin-type N-terminal cleavage/methylation domain-containing protein
MRKRAGFTLIELLVVVAVIAAAAVALLFAFGQGLLVDDDRAVEAARTHGFTDVRIVDTHVTLVRLQGCAEDDDVAYEIEAKNPAGEGVMLTVCCGWPLKGCTIRTR